MPNAGKAGIVVFSEGEGFVAALTRKQGAIVTDWVQEESAAKRYRSWKAVNLALVRLKEAGYTHVGYLTVQGDELAWLK